MKSVFGSRGKAKARAARSGELVALEAAVEVVGTPGNSSGAGDALPNPRTTVYTLTCTYCIFEKKEKGGLAIKAKFHYVGILLSSQEQGGDLWPKREQIGRRLSQLSTNGPGVS